MELSSSQWESTEQNTFFFLKKKELDKNQMSTYVSICLHIDND